MLNLLISNLYISLFTKHTYFQYLPIGDATMITSTSTIFTVFWARILIKEPIFKVDLLNFVLVFLGIIFIAKPPFIFGSYANMDSDDNPQAKWAILALVFSSAFLTSNVFVLLRMLKGIQGFIF